MGDTRKHETRERILQAAAEVLAEQGAEALSTRAVSAAAGVQAPTLYRLFGDKQGLLDALARHGFDRYVADKRGLAASADPVSDLRRGWDMHVDYGLANPAFYVLMYGSARPGHRPPAAEDAHTILVGLLERVAEAGRLRLPVAEAAHMIHAVGVGVTLALIREPGAAGGADLAARTRETVLAAITTDGGAAFAESTGDVAARALALEAALGQAPAGLTEAEAALLRQWLHRLAAAEHPVNG